MGECLDSRLLNRSFELRRSLSRIWQMRRVIITRDVMSFALMDDDDEIDFIPLAEVTSVDEMCGMEDAERDRGPGDRKLGSKGTQSSFNLILQDFKSGILDGDGESNNESTSRLFVNAFQIATIPDGYNSGRSYYLQADSGDVKQQIISQLQMLAKNAKKKADVTSSFRKAQDRVRSVYNARPFQSATALLIVAVIP
jgi:hypothetical protein